MVISLRSSFLLLAIALLLQGCAGYGGMVKADAPADPSNG